MLVSAPLLSVDELGPLPKGSKSNEKYLSEIPDLTGHCDPNFWKNRSLVELANMDPDETEEELLKTGGPGPYFIYRCSSGDKKLARNENFKRVPGAADVYGDAFVFKIKNPADWIYQLVVDYDSLGESFIIDAFKGKGIASDECLKWLSEHNE